MSKRDEKERAQVEEWLASNTEADRLRILDLLDSKNRKLSKRYGLVFEEGSDDEGGFEGENVAKTLEDYIPVPHYEPELSMTPEKAGFIAGGGSRTAT